MNDEDIVVAESSDEEDPVEDGDLIGETEINEKFKKCYVSVHNESVALKKTYILYADKTTDNKKLAVGLSTKEMQVYDITKTGLIKNVGSNQFGKFFDSVTGVKFFNNDPNILCVANADGFVHMYDLRNFDRICSLEDNDDKNYTCFDINSNNRIICAGTNEDEKGDVHLLFFDVRERKMMGGFFESHTEDVTDVKFHPTNSDRLATGSTDGLINIFDISKESEDDALEYSLNTENSVAKLKWHQNEEVEKLSCITNTNNLQIWDVSSQDLLKEWSREALTEAIQRKSVIDCNLIDCHNFGGKTMVLATSNYNKGECVRSLKFSSKKLKPSGNFLGNNQILRTSLYQEEDDVFYTFGEAGIISIWKEGDSSEVPEKSNLKEESSVKKKMKSKVNPY